MQYTDYVLTADDAITAALFFALHNGAWPHGQNEEISQHAPRLLLERLEASDDSAFFRINVVIEGAEKWFEEMGARLEEEQSESAKIFSSIDFNALRRYINNRIDENKARQAASMSGHR